MCERVNLIERSGLSANSQQENICFVVNKGVSESQDIKKQDRLQHLKISSLKLPASSKLPRYFSKAILYYKACPPSSLVLITYWRLSSLWLVLTLMLIQSVKQIQLTVHCTEEELRILSSTQTEVQRCSAVWAPFKYSVPFLHMGRLWCLCGDFMS